MTLVETKDELREKWRLANQAKALVKRGEEVPSENAFGEFTAEALDAEIEKLQAELSEVSGKLREEKASEKLDEPTGLESLSDEDLEAKANESSKILEEARANMEKVKKERTKRDDVKKLEKIFEGLTPAQRGKLEQRLLTKSVDSGEKVHTGGGTVKKK